MTELTRRQMRELERSGQIMTEPAPSLTPAGITPEPEASLPQTSMQQEPASTGTDRPMSRRELRAREANQGPDAGATQSLGRASALSKSLAQEVEEAPVQIEQQPASISEQPQGSRLGQPLPPVGSSRRERRLGVTAPAQLSEEIEPVPLEDLEIPAEGLMGANYLGELSTQSIVLDVAPEAIALPTDTGEIFTTGSIAILPDTTGSNTGSLDGIDLDTEEAVTGVISIVDPVSARDLIDERSPLGVVPSNVLRKGWWRPWAVGAMSILMAIAAILASLTIFNAIGG